LSGQARVRYALISDIHANLPALEAVLADIDARADVDSTYHLGDLVGYSAQPNEVVALLKARGIAGIAGNYDSTVATDYHHCGCRSESARQEELAHISYDFTRRAVSARTKQYLGTLPFSIQLRPFGGHTAGPRFTLVHGTPTLNTVYWTEDRPDAFCLQMAATAGLKAGDLIAFGHTHKPWHRCVDGIHFVNTGSVGRPKDGDWRAGYVRVEFSAEHAVSVEFRRVEYDIERTVQGVLQHNLPHEFADFLRSGGKS
jgi:predicted phosphodiesterase